MMNKNDMFNYTESDVKSYVSEIKKNPLLKDYNITEANANLYEQMAKSMSFCAHCKGLEMCKNNIPGYTKKVDGNSLKMCPCKYLISSEKLEKTNNLFKGLFIPKNVENSTLDNYKLSSESRKKALRASQNFISNIDSEDITGLYLHGDFGVGKTYLLAAIANEITRKGKSCILAYFPDLVRNIMNAMYDSEKLEGYINELKNVDVLMLDDLGGESETPWFRDEVLGPILNYRYMAKKPVCISSNLNPKDLTVFFSNTKNGEEDTIKGARIIKRISVLAGNIIKISNE